MIVNILNNLEKSLSTMSVNKAIIIDFKYNKDSSTYIEFQINNTNITSRKTLSLKYDDIKIGQEIHVIFNEKVFGDYILIGGKKSYENDEKNFLIMFIIFAILLAYPIFRLIKLYVENNGLV
jgi:hypothetical protein